jgi:hypothetical protein
MHGMVRTECTVTYWFKALPRSPALEHSDLVVQVMSGSSALTTCVNFLKCKVYHVLVLSCSLNCYIHVIFLDTLIIGLHMYSFTLNSCLFIEYQLQGILWVIIANDEIKEFNKARNI